ncbi:mechanosensitive ion channel domain-containing protein [Agrococcus sp. SCSIO52902]|uniref:mechanosensitive ion channel family protein n=1 Tax=Agrococcus sp. SCSIO52902 TaxID=2933290 RepID=UPI001FF63AF5|nr:mechanosensitive ion channel domain-containing protein [Agrococcus sp. SCSIO52902]UOW01143.1 mechanosensitive ion channel family protein [Agrococcus sp. SCSIO52902]
MPVIDVLALLGISIGVAVAAAVAASLVLVAGAAAATRSRSRIAAVRRPLRWPVAVLALLVAFSLASSATGLQRAMGEGGPLLAHALLILAIVAGAWLLVRLLRVAGDAVLARYGVAHGDRRAGKVRTQVEILRRVLAVVVVVIACGAVLFTFEAARVAGTSLLASAGVASLVAGLAAQSVLGNVFAGIQLVASDAIRVDDVVVVEGEWGTIEEITLTYVVVRIWDDRRLVLPSTHFTTTPFENWTRTSSEVMGAVELDVDWSVPVDGMRHELARILDGHPHWDGRDSVLQVTDAVGGVVRVRVLVTAADGGELASLRADVRERLVAWLREQHPDALPRQRFEAVPVT